MEICTFHLEGSGTLPLVAQSASGGGPAAAELSEYITVNGGWLTQALHRHGGVLFRNFQLREVEDFQRVARAIIPELLPYVEGQSPRTKVIDNIYTSTEFPAQFTITPHNELSYAKSPPPRIIFHCSVAPEEGGETPIFDFRRVYSAMDPDVRQRFENAGVKYVKNMHGGEQGLGKSWMQHFETDDRSVVEKYLRDNEIQFEWKRDGGLKTWSIRPATMQHPVTGEWHWFNQANLWHVSNVDERHRAQLLARCGEDQLPTHAYYGDGTDIPDKDLDHVRKVMWENAVVFPWQQGDVLILDNFLIAHGRMPFKGPRKILVAMG